MDCEKEKKLVIQTHKYGGESVVMSVRMPKTMLTAIDDVAKKTGRNRNGLILLSLEFALEHMEID